MLIVTWFVGAVRHGALGIGWLCGLSLLIGLGLGPVIGYLTEVDPGAITTAAGITALTVLGMGALGFVLSKDLVGLDAAAVVHRARRGRRSASAR